jgi:hypothetical protein
MAEEDEMKTIRTALFLVIASCLLSGCAMYAGGYYLTPDDQPGYIYVYPDGCWADDLWYSPCPWTPGPNYGYYYYSGGYYYWHPNANWQYRPGYPPPRAWRFHHPNHPRFPSRPPHRPHGPYPHHGPSPHHGHGHRR